VVNAAGQAGAFSNTLNTTTGLITTTSINPGDVTEFVDDTDITWTALTANNNTETDTSDYTSAVVGSINETIQYQGFFEFEYESTYGNAANDNLLRFQLFRRADGATTEGTQIGDDIDLDFHSSIPTLGTGNVSATTFVVFPKDNPGAGTFEYALKVSAISGHTLNFMNFQGTKLTVQIRNDKV
jgi:hypothetical protein